MAPITKWSGTLRPDGVLQVLVPGPPRGDARPARTGPRGLPGRRGGIAADDDVRRRLLRVRGAAAVAGGSVAARDASGRARASRCCSSDLALAAPRMPPPSGRCAPRRRVPAMVTYKAKGVVPDDASVVRRRVHQRRDRAADPRRERSAHRDRPRSGRADSARVDSASSPSSPAVPGTSRTRTCRLPSQFVADVPERVEADRALRCRRRTGIPIASASSSTISGGGSTCPAPASPRSASSQIAASRLAAARRTRDRRRRRAHVSGDDVVAGDRAERHAHLQRLVDDGVRAAGGDWRGAPRSRTAGGRADRRRRAADVRRRAPDGGREKLRIITIVFSDASLSLIEIKQQARRLEPAGVALGADRLAGPGRQLRRADRGWPRLKPSSIARPVRRWRATDRRLIEAKIDRSNYGATRRGARVPRRASGTRRQLMTEQLIIDGQRVDASDGGTFDGLRSVHRRSARDRRQGDEGGRRSRRQGGARGARVEGLGRRAAGRARPRHDPHRADASRPRRGAGHAREPRQRQAAAAVADRRPGRGPLLRVLRRHRRQDHGQHHPARTRLSSTTPCASRSACRPRSSRGTTRSRSARAASRRRSPRGARSC